MTAFLVGASQQTIVYDRRSGRYREASTGKYVSRAAILRLVDEEAARLSTRMKAHTRLLTTNRIDLPEWQRRSAEELKLSHIRSTILGSGGRSLTSSEAYGSTGRELRRQYEYLQGFAQDLAAGKLTRTQALSRAASYGGSTRTAFHKAEKIARGREGFKEAMRDLDPAAKHCGPCIRYSTNGLWVPLEDVVMTGVRCDCFHFCRCRVKFRKRPQKLSR